MRSFTYFSTKKLPYSIDENKIRHFHNLKIMYDTPFTYMVKVDIFPNRTVLYTYKFINS